MTTTTLNPGQEEAVKFASSSPLTLIQGPPGKGDCMDCLNMYPALEGQCHLASTTQLLEHLTDWLRKKKPESPAVSQVPLCLFECFLLISFSKVRGRPWLVWRLPVSLWLSTEDKELEDRCFSARHRIMQLMWRQVCVYANTFCVAQFELSHGFGKTCLNRLNNPPSELKRLA